jgi:hypothetical protein
MNCIDCEYFKIIQHPLPDHYDAGLAECRKYNLIVDFFTKSKLKRLTCEDRPKKDGE